MGLGFGVTLICLGLAIPQKQKSQDILSLLYRHHILSRSIEVVHTKNATCPAEGPSKGGEGPGLRSQYELLP